MKSSAIALQYVTSELSLCKRVHGIIWLHGVHSVHSVHGVHGVHSVHGVHGVRYSYN